MQDAVPGIYPRWHVSFNITMLRLVSFNMDYYWACNKAGSSDVSSATPVKWTLWLNSIKPGSTLTDKQRPTVRHSLETYSYANYIAYVLYPPLYIAGPIMTFNDFMWQVSP